MQSNLEEADGSIRVVADIIVAYLSQRVVEPDELAALIVKVRRALTCDLEAETPSVFASRRAEAASINPPAESAPVAGRLELAEEPTAVNLRPAVPIEDSVTDDYIVSLEDGQAYRSLRRHLMAKYKLTPDAYRAKWGLPPDYPMVAPSYARERSAVAKRIGLGRSAIVEEKPAAKQTGKKARVAKR